MHPNRVHRLRLLAAGAALVAVIAPGANAAERYIPGITDSSTGVLRELERRHDARSPYIPGVTDSSTGVLRELERRSLEPGRSRPAADADSGVAAGEAGVAIAAALAAAAALALGMRRRRGLVAA